ncbi:type 4a pilus biogenesis protein PilO [Phosphitispora fastidiosa]|uniref:type 4a pilus biogenesis protein PilO n=1 Tax=Phosphitispora fastidiosa TaxID=2837202 RepID=UPI001E39D8E5|nr:type 4a pilus biogenesis protein PilO [Phosphitispora fastidiosa]MBU7008765.1 Tfp pilus assembly protein PilO [Phosphitispora fastidiosa]
MISGLSRREQNIILIGILVAFVAVFYVYLVQPVWQELAARKLELSALEEKLAVLEGEQKRLEDQKGDTEQLKKEVGVLRAQLPVTRETAGLIHMLYSYAVATGVTVNEFNTGEFAENTAVPGTRILPVSIKISGTYTQLRQFAAKLEKPQRLLYINGMSIDQYGNNVKGNISLSVFSAKTGNSALNNQDSIPRSPAKGKNNPFV